MTFTQFVCGITWPGHTYIIKRERRRLFQQCITCQRERPGWDLSTDLVPPVRTLDGDPVRHQISKPLRI
jgi:hypothetical protein